MTGLLNGHSFESNRNLTAKPNQHSIFLPGDVETPDLWYLTEKVQINEHSMAVGMILPSKVLETCLVHSNFGSLVVSL